MTVTIKMDSTTDNKPAPLWMSCLAWLILMGGAFGVVYVVWMIFTAWLASVPAWMR